jgi:hypothetical protein
MADPLAGEDSARLRQAFALGLSRQPLTLAIPELAVLALTSQRQRFERPTTAELEPLAEAAVMMHQDDRPLIPDRARRCLLRLVSGARKGADTEIIGAAARRAARAGRRLHPFDLPAMAPYMKAISEMLGLAERAYLALTDRSVTEDAAPSLLNTEIDATIWTQFPKKRRAAFLRRERARDPAAARALLEGVFKSEPALVRAELLGALDVALSADDLPFLGGLVSDRAESVRSTATSLIGRMPGTAAYDARLADAAACFPRASGVSKLLAGVGLTGAVAFKPQKDSNPEALAALFAGLPANAVAEKAGITVAQLLDALPADDVMIVAAFLATATARSGPGSKDATDLVMHKLSPDRSGAYPNGYALKQLAAALGDPLPAGFALDLLASQKWQAALARFAAENAPPSIKDDGTLVTTAAMLPAEAMPRFIETLTPLPPHVTRTPCDFCEFVIAMSTEAI